MSTQTTMAIYAAEHSLVWWSFCV